MSAAVDSWRVAVEHDRGLARCTGQEVAAATPAELWRLLAERSAGRVVHLLGEEMEPQPAAVAKVASAIGGDDLGAAIGRVRRADGRLSSRFGKIEVARFLAVPAGAVIARAESLPLAAEEVLNGWDGFWAADLANGLRHTTLVEGVGEVLAVSRSAPPPSERLPFARASTAPPPEGRSPLILIYGKLEASMSLYFDGLPPDLRARLRFLEPGDLYSDLGWLASASLVIVLRGFEHMLETGTLPLLREIGVPYMWFTDDDYSVLEGPDFSFYSPEALAAFTAGAAGVLVTSAALGAALSSLNRRVVLWPAVHDAALQAPSGAPGLRAGAFGGAFRRKAMAEHVFPALRAVSIPTWASAELAHGLPGVTLLPFESSFRRFVFRWQKLGLRALVHPEGVAANLGNKSRASLLAAAYLGAVPVVGDEPAYSGVGESEGVLKVARADQAGWQAALSRLTDAGEAAALRRRLDGWCRTEFDPERARQPFAELLALCLPGGPEMQAMRWQRAMESEALRQASPRASPLRKAAGRLLRGFRRRLAGRAGGRG